MEQQAAQRIEAVVDRAADNKLAMQKAGYRPKHVWRDTSSWTQSTTPAERLTPKEYTVQVEGIRISLHHHMDYEPSVWLVSAHQVGIKDRMMIAAGALEAQAEALQYIRDYLSNILRAL